VPEVIFFEDDDGCVPFLEWFDKQPQKVQDKCIVRIERLAQMGNQLRRPEADYLRDGIYELRVSRQGVQYRMLYFFHEGRAITHGLVKEDKVPEIEIDRGIERMMKFQATPH
jgi:hypothetical protein